MHATRMGLEWLASRGLTSRWAAGYRDELEYTTFAFLPTLVKSNLALGKLLWGSCSYISKRAACFQTHHSCQTNQKLRSIGYRFCEAADTILSQTSISPSSARRI